MLSLAEAQATIVARIRACASRETVALADAHGRFLAAAVHACVDNPAFDNSSMDGYAVNSADLQGAPLPLLGESRCGQAPATLARGTAMRIFTGAPLPEGADAVTIQEEVTVADGAVRFPRHVAAGDNIRRRGEDFKRGDSLYAAGRRISSYDLALIAAAGQTEVDVFTRPRVLIAATGDELANPGAALQAGQIYESNRLATALQLRELGADVIDGGIVPDNAAALEALLAQAHHYDFIITSGGASVGDYDLIKPIFERIGEIDFWKVRIKPGKPVAFGRIGARTHFFALPGNPVSSLVTFKLFVEPALYAWHGAPAPHLTLRAVAANAYRRHAGRMEFVRAHLSNIGEQLQATALPGQGSHMLGTLRNTNALIIVPADSAGFAAGESVSVMPLRLDI